MKLGLLDRLLALRRAGHAAALVTDLVTGAQLLIGPEGIEGDLVLSAEDLAEAHATVAVDTSRTIGAGSVFVEVWNPPLRLIIIGAVHIAQFLAPMAAMTGYRVTVVDPRGAFATAQRFPDVELVAQWPDEVLPGLEPDKRTAIVALSHDIKIDDPGLRAALGTDAFYIGALGSRRNQAARLERLIAAGFPAAAVRVLGPVGLPIGGRSPAEIAVSILAEMTAVLHQTPIATRASRPG